MITNCVLSIVPSIGHCFVRAKSSEGKKKRGETAAHRNARRTPRNAVVIRSHRRIHHTFQAIVIASVPPLKPNDTPNRRPGPHAIRIYNACPSLIHHEAAARKSTVLLARFGTALMDHATALRMRGSAAGRCPQRSLCGRNSISH